MNAVVVQARQTGKVEPMNTEERVAKLEVKVEHIQSDLSDVKADVRELRGDVKTLTSDLHTFKLGFERFKGQVWVAFAVMIVLQVLALGGVPAAIARAIKWP